MKVIINDCFGGFSVSKAVYDALGIKWDGYGYLSEFESENFRTDERLIRAVESVGLDKASGIHAKLKIVDIPDDVQFRITEYDGWESVEEIHRSWG